MDQQVKQTRISLIKKQSITLRLCLAAMRSAHIPTLKVKSRQLVLSLRKAYLTNNCLTNKLDFGDSTILSAIGAATTVDSRADSG